LLPSHGHFSYDRLVAHVSAAERRPQLIRAAIDVMIRDGVAAGSTRAIAAELGIAQAMVHYVYGSKDELFRAVIEQLTTDVSARVRDRVETPPDADFRTAVAAYARGLWQTVAEQPEVYQLLQELAVTGLRSPSLRTTISQYQRQLDAAFEHTFRTAAARTGTAPVRPIADVSRFFFASLDGLLAQRLSRGPDDADERTLNDLVAATTALAEGRLPLADSSTGV
jgi:AcrR family transcriptional regulator